MQLSVALAPGSPVAALAPSGKRRGGKWGSGNSGGGGWLPIAAARSQGRAALPAEQCTVATLMVRNHAACPDVLDTNTGISRRVKDRKNCRAAGAHAFRRHMMIPAQNVGPAFFPRPQSRIALSNRFVLQQRL
jgi:hypothetical protein